MTSAAYLFRNATSEERLLSRLFKEYEPIARAVMDVSKTVAVSIDFLLLRIHGLVSLYFTNVKRITLYMYFICQINSSF